MSVLPDLRHWAPWSAVLAVGGAGAAVMNTLSTEFRSRVINEPNDWPGRFYVLYHIPIKTSVVHNECAARRRSVSLTKVWRIASFGLNIEVFLIMQSCCDLTVPTGLVARDVN